MATNHVLAVTDPLAGQTVTLLITVAATGQPRDARPVLVSVAPAGQLPALRHGRFGDLPALIDAAWTTASAVQAQLVEDGAISAEQVVAVVDSEEAPRAPAAPARPGRDTPPPPAQNLSLF